MDDGKQEREAQLSAVQPGAALTRTGEPIDVELHDVGNPEQFEAKSATHTLTDMAVDYEFFTTAVIHVATLFDRDPVAEFSRVYPLLHDDELPLIIDYQHPFFTGLGVALVAGMPVNLDHRLYAVRRDHWANLRDVVSSIAMYHSPTKFFARINFYEMQIVDPFALRGMSVVERLPMVPVTVFGVSSNKAFSYIKPDVYPRLPYLTQEAPKADAEAECSRLLTKAQIKG